MKPQAVEFLVHMSLATVALAVNSLVEEVVIDEVPNLLFEESVGEHGVSVLKFRSSGVTRPVTNVLEATSRCIYESNPCITSTLSTVQAVSQKMSQSAHVPYNHCSQPTPHNKPRSDGPHRIFSVTGAQLNLQWDSLRNVEYLTDGGNNW